jgi:hypothetical protein
MDTAATERLLGVKKSSKTTAGQPTPPDRRVQRELELLEAVASVPPAVRRRIQRDTVLEIAAPIALLVVLHFVFL